MNKKIDSKSIAQARKSIQTLKQHIAAISPDQQTLLTAEIEKIANILEQLPAIDEARDKIEHPNKKLNTHAQRQAKEIALLEQLLSNMAHEPDLQEIIDNLVESVAKSFGYRLVSLYLRQGDTMVLQHQVGYEQVLDQIPITKGIVGKVMRFKQPIILKDVHTDPDFLEAIQGITSEICVPLFEREEVVGVLNVECTSENELTDTDLRLLVALSEHISIALGRARLYSNIQESEERYRRLFENKHTVMLLIDPETGAIVDANPAACDFYGTAHEDLLRLKISEINTLSEAEIKVEMERARTEERTFFNFRHRLMNGVIRDVEVYSGPINVGGKQLLFSVVHDDTERKKAEVNLQQKTEELDHFFNIALDLLCIADTNGYFRRLNMAWEKTMQYSLSELEGKRFLDFVHPDDIDSTMAAIAELSIQHPVTNFINRYRCKDGTYRWIEWRSAPSGDLIYAAARDITNRKETEEALTRLAAIVETSDDAISSQTLDGTVVSWNVGAEKLYGYSPEEMIGKSIIKILPPGKEDDLVQILEQIMAGKRISHYETQRQSKDGRVIDVSLTISPIMDNSGQITGLSSIVRDISDRKQIQDEIYRSRQMLQLVLDTIPQRVFWKNLDFTYLGCNRSAALDAGLTSPAEIIGQNDYDLAWKEYADLYRTDDRWIMENDSPRINYEEPQVRPDGSQYWLRTNKVPMHDRDGKVIGLLGTYEDITEQKRAEQELLLAGEKLKLWVSELEQRNHEEELLRQMGDMLQICHSVDEAYGVIQQYGPQLFPEITGALYILNNSRRYLEIAANWGEPLHSEHIFTPNECWALRRGQLQLTDAALAGIHCQHMPPTFKGIYIDAPMMASGELFGLFHIESSHQQWEQHNFKELARTMADHLTLSLSNLNLRDTLRAQSIRDPLTGLYNRRYMEESLERELHRAERKKSPVGIIMLDIDHFKHFNDTYGHNAGDAVLRELGALLQHNIRGEDIACRFGGEEFLLILPDTTLEVTEQRAEHIRTVVKDMIVEHRHKSLGAITISLGVAVYPDHGTSTEGILGKADEALYQAKHKGRDRVEKA